MAIRLKGTVVGDGGDPDASGSPSLVSIRGSLVNPDSGTLSIFALTTAIASQLSADQSVSVYIALNGTEVTQIEGSGITVTPASTVD